MQSSKNTFRQTMDKKQLLKFKKKKKEETSNLKKEKKIF